MDEVPERRIPGPITWLTDERRFRKVCAFVVATLVLSALGLVCGWAAIFLAFA